MKLTSEQSQEIKEQQSQQNKTKRVTAPALEDILSTQSQSKLVWCPCHMKLLLIVQLRYRHPYNQLL